MNLRSLVVFVTVCACLCALSLVARSQSYEIPTKPTDAVQGCPKALWGSHGLIDCFLASAHAFRNQPTKWRHTNCPGQPDTYTYWGHCACAAAATVAIMNASHKDLSYINVDQFEALAENGTLGGYFPVKDAQAKAGDVILWYSRDRTEAHVGFCADAGCIHTWSNSSSRGTFAPQDHSTTLDGYYPTHEIWEPRHLP